MRTPFTPERAYRWKHDPIGAYTGRVSDDGAGVVAYAGPRNLEVQGEALPPPGTEVAFVVVMVWARGEPRRFFAKNVRRIA